MPKDENMMLQDHEEEIHIGIAGQLNDRRPDEGV